MPEYYDRAYGAYRDKQGDLKDTYSILSAQEQKDYDRFRDEYGDWLTEREYLTARADMERSLDRGEFESERDYWTALAQQENADYWTGQNFEENKRQYDTTFNENQRQFNAEIEEKQRQFNESLEWDKMSTQQKYAAEYCMQILAAGGMPSDELLKQAGLSAADAELLKAQPVTTGGGGGGGGKKTTTTTTGGDPEVEAAYEQSQKATQGTPYGQWKTDQLTKQAQAQQKTTTTTSSTTVPYGAYKTQQMINKAKNKK